MKKPSADPKTRTLWLLAYDLPADQPCQKNFYRNAKKILGQTRVSEITSSRSVVATRDEKIAKALYSMAAQCGTAHLFTARKVNTLTRKY